MASIRKRPDGQWRARYRDAAGTEHAKHFGRKVDATGWLAEQTADEVTGRWVAPKARKTTVEAWCGTWLAGYANRRPSTLRLATAHVAKIVEAFGPLPLAAVRPSAVKSWVAGLRSGDRPLSVSYVHALHSRLAQILGDAVLDGVLAASPCSRRTSPPTGAQRPYVATTEQVWELHDAMPPRHRLAILLGAFAGLRIGEACGLRPADVAFLHREIRPAVQHPAEPLKTAMSATPIPVADSLLAEVSEQIRRWPGPTVLTVGQPAAQMTPRMLDGALRRARGSVAGLPAGFRYQDLRHYFASLLIASGADVKTVQQRLRHASATTTLNVYAHLWPDTEESTRSAVESIMSARRPADSVRTTEITP